MQHRYMLTDEWTHATIKLANGQLDKMSSLGFVPNKLTINFSGGRLALRQ